MAGQLSEMIDHRALLLPCLAVVGGGGVVLMVAWRLVKDRRAKSRLLCHIKQRQEEVAGNKKLVSDFLSKYEPADKRKLEVLSQLPVKQLVQKLQGGDTTALEVLRAYQARALQVDLQTNCVVEFIEEAEVWAKELDGKPVKGPLHGIPVSVKETYNLEGYDCTSGLAKLLHIPCCQEAAMLSALKSLGAVPFVRTNIVQTTCSMGSSNPIYGETVNPWSSNRIPGGSTSGEGALLALGGSVLGLGTDLGGSVRIPAAMCGICSLKPTQRRFSGFGIKPSLRGIVGVHDTPGIMANDVATLVVAFKNLMSGPLFELDPRVAPLSFQSKIFDSQRPLRIGYYESDGLVMPTPGCRRAVRVAVDALKKQGHQLVRFSIPSIREATDLGYKLAGCDGGNSITEMMKHEPVSWPMSFIKKSLMQKILGVFGIHTMKLFVPHQSEISAYELWKLLDEREQYVDRFLADWMALNLDVLVGPGYPVPAFASEHILGLGGTVMCTMLYNILNFPSGAVSVTHESEQDQKDLQDNFDEPDDLHANMKKAAEGAIGMPLGIQVIGLPWQEEQVLRVMGELQKRIRDGN